MRWLIAAGLLIMMGCTALRLNFQLPTSNSQLLYGSNRDGDWELYTMDLTSGKERRLTNSQADDLWPAWDPNGERIAFVSNRDGNRELYVMEADGSRQMRLTYTEAGEEDPDWSGNGQRIAFTSFRDGNEEIYLINLLDLVEQRLTSSPGMDAMPVWSPIISGGPCAPPSADAPMPPDDSDMGPLRFADANPHMPHTRRGQAKPDPRPAQPLAKPEGCLGEQILFVSTRDGNPELYVLSLGSQFTSPQADHGSQQLSALSSQLRRLTHHPASDGMDSHVWSPDGNQIAFVSNRDGNAEIYLLSLGSRFTPPQADHSSQQLSTLSSQLRRLTHHPAMDDGPAWSPDGRNIAFISDRDGDLDIYVLSLPSTLNSQPRRLTEAPGPDLWPVWSPDGSRIAFISERDGNPEVYVMQADGTHQRRMTHTTAEEKWVSWKK